MAFKRQRKAPINGQKRGRGRPPGSKNKKNGDGNGNPFEFMSAHKARFLFESHQREIEEKRREFDTIEEEKYQKEVTAAAANGTSPPPRRRRNNYGAPTKYKGDQTCIQVIQLMSTGRGLTEVAGEIGVVKDTMEAWMNKHPEFAVAVQIGQTLSETWWLDMGRNALGLGKNNFNSVQWMMNMTNRFNWVRKDERTETVKGTKEHTHTHVVDEIARSSSEHTAEVIRILVESGVLSAEAQKPANTSIH